MQPSDDILVAECLQGSQTAFRELVERHQNRIYSLALRMTGRPADAEDLAQEAFIRAYQALGRYRPSRGAGFGAWLTRIVVNLCLNAIRDGRKAVSVEPADLERLHGSNSVDVIARERDRQVQAAVESLDGDYRAVVVLRFTEGMSYREIADALGVPITTVETRLHRAKKRLRELLQESM